MNQISVIKAEKLLEDSPEFVERFERRIANGEKIEPTDPMPQEYKGFLIRQISAHAHAEITGMLPEGNWLTRAPTLKRKAALVAKVQDEGGHGLYLYAAAETLGVTREEMTMGLIEGTSAYAPITNYPTLSWADIGCFGWLVDGGAIYFQVPLCRSSYGPYARAMVRICKEESFHQRHGFDIMTKLCEGTPEQKEMAQDALNRWWWPTLMMFGIHDGQHTAMKTGLKWKLLRQTNDEMRQKFIDATVPQAKFLGLEIPDPDMKWDPSKNEGKGGYTHGEIDWDEFHRILKGKSPTAQDRVAVRRKAWEDGAWVREAARVHAEKREAQKIAAE